MIFGARNNDVMSMTRDFKNYSDNTCLAPDGYMHHRRSKEEVKKK
jgi:hypothetical protein